MKRDKNIFFLTADLGFNALESLQRAFPKRFLNVGIAEQHMMGLASGLALEGKTVVAYSIASFATMRPFEQIRDDICYNNLNVKIIGTGGGYNYATHGITHHTVEDIAIMNALPHMQVLCPGYSWEATEATKALFTHTGPMYLRIGKSPGVAYQKEHFAFELGRGYVVAEGNDIVLLSTGNILDVAIATAQLLNDVHSISTTVISMPSIKPFDEQLLLKHARKASGIFTLEEHSTTGGLGDIVARTLMKNGVEGKRLKMFGLPPEKFIKDVGDRNYLLDAAGLSAKKLAAAIHKEIQ